MVTTLLLAAQSPCCRQLSTVTTPLLSSHCIVTMSRRWLIELSFAVHESSFVDHAKSIFSTALMLRMENYTIFFFLGCVNYIQQLKEISKKRYALTWISTSLNLRCAATILQSAFEAGFRSLASCVLAKWLSLRGTQLTCVLTDGGWWRDCAMMYRLDWLIYWYDKRGISQQEVW